MENRIQTDRIGAAFDKILQEFPERRRELHERVGRAVQRELQQQIASSGINDSSGRVRRWQVAHVGSGGGYAAVRPEKGKTGADSPGAITNYLEGGYRIASPRGGKNYRPPLRVSYVSGYHFYANTSMRAESIAIGEAEAWADEIARELEASL